MVMPTGEDLANVLHLLGDAESRIETLVERLRLGQVPASDFGLTGREIDRLADYRAALLKVLEPDQADNAGSAAFRVKAHRAPFIIRLEIFHHDSRSRSRPLLVAGRRASGGARIVECGLTRVDRQSKMPLGPHARGRIAIEQGETS